MPLARRGAGGASRTRWSGLQSQVLPLLVRPERTSCWRSSASDSRWPARRGVSCTAPPRRLSLASRGRSSSTRLTCPVVRWSGSFALEDGPPTSGACCVAANCRWKGMGVGLEASMLWPWNRRCSMRILPTAAVLVVTVLAACASVGEQVSRHISSFRFRVACSRWSRGPGWDLHRRH